MDILYFFKKTAIALWIYLNSAVPVNYIHKSLQKNTGKVYLFYSGI